MKSKNNTKIQITREGSEKGSLSLLLGIGLLVLGVLLISLTKAPLRSSAAALNANASKTPLYLPEAKYIRMVSMGFDSFASDLLWFNTINYFGREYDTTKDYKWLGHMCDLVTQLDDRAKHVYEFCATMLSWVAKEPEFSNKILTRGIDAMPDYWRLRYLKGFNYWYFLEDRENAEKELTAASETPECPAFVITMAARLKSAEEDPKTAMKFLEDMIKNTKDERAKTELIEKYNLAKVSVAKIELKKAITAFEEKEGKKIAKLDELLTAGIIKGNLQDPFGGAYYLDEQGEIQTTSGKKGLVFSGKTARTGLVRKEWNN